MIKSNKKTPREPLISTQRLSLAKDSLCFAKKNKILRIFNLAVETSILFVVESKNLSTFAFYNFGKYMLSAHDLPPNLIYHRFRTTQIKGAYR